MKAWLPEEATYVKVTLETMLQGQLSRGNSAILKIIYRQITDALGGEPTSMRWEQEGKDVVVGAALSGS